MADDRDAAKRRASFGRADRLRKETQQKTEQTKIEERRKAERDKSDQLRKAEAVKAAEHRNVQARKRAEQRRLERQQENLKKEFSRKVEYIRTRIKHVDQQKKAEAAKLESQKAAERDPRHRDAETYVAQQEKRQARDQLDEQRRQTNRLRTEHNAERLNARDRQAGAIIDHARRIRNIDIAERRELEALDVQRRSLAGRFTSVVKGPGHFARQEQAIVDRHDNDRWQKHRDHESKKDELFWTAQAKRLGQVVERRDMTKAHEGERQELKQAQERGRPQKVDARMKAMVRPSEQRVLQQDNVRPAEPFGRAAGQSLENKR